MTLHWDKGHLTFLYQTLTKVGVRVQRYRTNILYQTYISRERNLLWGICLYDYGVNKSQDLLQSASWRPRTAHCVVSIWGPAALRPGNCQYFCPSLRAGKGQCPNSCSEVVRIPLFWSFCSIQAFHWGRQAASFSLQIQILISSRDTLTDTPKIMCNQISGPPLPSHVDTKN